MSVNLIILSVPKITSALYNSMPEVSGGTDAAGPVRIRCREMGKGGISGGGRVRCASRQV